MNHTEFAISTFNKLTEELGMEKMIPYILKFLYSTKKEGNTDVSDAMCNYEESFLDWLENYSPIKIADKDIFRIYFFQNSNKTQTSKWNFQIDLVP